MSGVGIKCTCFEHASFYKSRCILIRCQYFYNGRKLDRCIHDEGDGRPCRRDTINIQPHVGISRKSNLVCATCFKRVPREKCVRTSRYRTDTEKRGVSGENGALSLNPIKSLITSVFEWRRNKPGCSVIERNSET